MVYLFLADGFEMVEALAPVDLLRRAGVDVKTVSIVTDKLVYSSHKVGVMADITINDVVWNDAQALILPGGMPGTKNLAACEELMSKVDSFAAEGKLIAAICAAPALTFGERGLLVGKRATCYPNMEEHLKGAEFIADEVVVDGNIITSRGMGTAIPFGLSLIEKLVGPDKADEVKKSVVFKA